MGTPEVIPSLRIQRRVHQRTMSESRSVSRSVSCGTISIDASYAQELLDFWTKKYEQVKGELDQIKVGILR